MAHAVKLEEYLDDLRFFKKSKRFLHLKKKKRKEMLNRSRSSNSYMSQRSNNSFRKGVKWPKISSPIGTRKILKEENSNREYKMISNMKASKLS